MEHCGLLDRRVAALLAMTMLLAMTIPLSRNSL